MPGLVGAWVGGCLGGWVHKGVSEGVKECMAWFGGVGVCSLISKRYEFFSMYLFPWVFLPSFLSMGFSPWV